jgi:hypothetical protein
LIFAYFSADYHFPNSKILLSQVQNLTSNAKELDNEKFDSRLWKSFLEENQEQGVLVEFAEPCVPADVEAVKHAVVRENLN